ncbi:MAG: 2OG-Fe(II) oxygenase [Pseudomonadota bacterium]
MNHDTAVINDPMFAALAEDLRTQGYSVKPDAVPLALANSLRDELKATAPGRFKLAQMGRLRHQHTDQQLRGDSTLWIDDQSKAGLDWLNWTAQLQTYLNQHLLLGLFSFESHFAHYPPGSAYTRHRDTFVYASKHAIAKDVESAASQDSKHTGQSNSANAQQAASSRVLSLVTYLNPDWSVDAGGELVLYTKAEAVEVLPVHKTLVVFLSEEFEHEVRPATADRFSVAGWYRRNTSLSNRVDPPN